jgi:ribosomal 50S subunit-recycling heat shock protein
MRNLYRAEGRHVLHSETSAYENGVVTGVRIDKWLWAARFFKTRPLAAQACGLGRIECNGQPAKASREVRVGDRLQVKNEGGIFQVEVVRLSEMRGPARLRRRCISKPRRARNCG